jgi:hypothetical protein
MPVRLPALYTAGHNLLHTMYEKWFLILQSTNFMKLFKTLNIQEYVNLVEVVLSFPEMTIFEMFEFGNFNIKSNLRLNNFFPKIQLYESAKYV